MQSAIEVAEDQKCTHFRQWLEMNEAEIIDFDKGEFKESGTIVGTSLIFLTKKQKEGGKADNQI